MKLPKLQLSSKSLKTKPGFVLVAIFALLLGYEIYLLYYDVYTNLTTEVQDISVNTNIVHLDLANYQKMLDLLDSVKVYTPPPITVDNPFSLSK